MPLPAQRGVLLRGLLSNGLRVVIWYDPDLDLEDACLAVGVGSQLDMEHKQGAAALVAGIVRNGHSGEAASEVRQKVEPGRKADTAVTRADPGKLRRATGWVPRIPLDQTLADILADWREQAG